MTKQTVANTTRLATIRRLYLYLIAFISLVAGLSAAYGLIDIFAGLWLTADAVIDVDSSGNALNAIARQGGFLIVSAPIFLIHWRFIRRLAAQPGESSAALRKLFVYALLAITGFISAGALYLLIEGSLEILLGNPLPDSVVRPGRWQAQFFHAGIHLALFLAFARMLRTDGDLGTEVGWAGSWRRLFQLFAGLMGLGLLNHRRG